MAKSNSTTSASFWDSTTASIQEALDIRKQIDALKAKVDQLMHGDVKAIPPSQPPKRGRKKGSVNKAQAAPAVAPKAKPTEKKSKMSPEARAKIAAAQKARWAAQKGQTASPKQSKSAPKKKGGMTPEGRARLAAAMKARWAAKKAAAK